MYISILNCLSYFIVNLDSSRSRLSAEQALVSPREGPASPYNAYLASPLTMTEAISEAIKSNPAFLDAPALEKLREVLLVEEPLLRRYIHQQAEHFKQTIAAIYTCLMQVSLE